MYEQLLLRNKVPLFPTMRQDLDTILKIKFNFVAVKNNQETVIITTIDVVLHLG